MSNPIKVILTPVITFYQLIENYYKLKNSDDLSIPL